MEEGTFSFEKLKVYQVARALVKDMDYIEKAQLDALRPQFAEVAKMMSGLRKSFDAKI